MALLSNCFFPFATAISIFALPFLKYIFVGTNVKPSLCIFPINLLISLLFNKIEIIKSSSNFESLSWPNPLNPNFINIVIKIKTNIQPLELLKICNSIEKKLGRKRSTINAPRSCDIDIIDYKQKIVNLENNNLILPHPRMNKRNFVILPLFEINKSWKHPISKKNIVNLLSSLPIKDLRSIKQM